MAGERQKEIRHAAIHAVGGEQVAESEFGVKRRRNRGWTSDYAVRTNSRTLDSILCLTSFQVTGTSISGIGSSSASSK